MLGGFIGDFNEYTFQYMKLRGRLVKKKRVDKFLPHQLMDACNVHDVGCAGNKFTWTNKRKKKPIF